jgi:Tfp pilus assembly protein PilO
MALSKREQKLLTATVVILAVGASYAILAPLLKGWGRAGRSLTAQRRELGVMKSIVQRQPAWEEEYAQLRASLNQAPQRFNAASDVLKKIEEVGAGSGVIISARRSRKEEDRGVYMELPVDCTVEATTESLVRFLYALQTAAGFMRVEQLQVSPKPDNPALLRCDIQVRALSVKAEGPAL